MKSNKGKYPEVEKLPPNAMSVKNYAVSKGIDTAYVYKLIRTGKNDFKIVIFQTVNYIIP